MTPSSDIITLPVREYETMIQKISELTMENRRLARAPHISRLPPSPPHPSAPCGDIPLGLVSSAAVSRLTTSQKMTLDAGILRLVRKLFPAGEPAHTSATSTNEHYGALLEVLVSAGLEVAYPFGNVEELGERRDDGSRRLGDRLDDSVVRHRSLSNGNVYRVWRALWETVWGVWRWRGLGEAVEADGGEDRDEDEEEEGEEGEEIDVVDVVDVVDGVVVESGMRMV